MNIVFFVVAATIVLLRCYTRAVISKAFGIDDWLMVAACVCLPTLLPVRVLRFISANI